jgi:hypothetical protein
MSPLSGARWSGGAKAETAVDFDHLAGDEIRIGGGKKADGRGDVVRRAPALAEGFLLHSLLPVFGSPFAPSGSDPAEGEAIDADLRR